MQETLRDDADDVASQVYAAIRRAGYDPHGDLAGLVFASVRRANRDVDDMGRSVSTHPADLAAEAAAEAGASADEVQDLRSVAAEEGTRTVGEFLRRVGGVLQEAELLEPPARPERPVRRLFIDLTTGELASVLSVPSQLTAAELEEIGADQAALLELAKMPVLGPECPPRDLAGARLLLEQAARDLAAGRRCDYQTWAQLDAAIARWAGCSARRARTERLQVWGIRGRRGVKGSGA